MQPESTKRVSEYRQAEVRYREIRSQVRAMVLPAVRTATGHPVELTEITPDAAELAAAWRPQYSDKEREPAWDWGIELRRARRRPRRVELAIWCNGLLCGMALGRISDRCVVATVHLMESNPEQSNPLGGMVAPITVRFLDALALLLGCEEVSLESPVPALVDYYRGLGFTREVRKGRKLLRLKKSIRS